MSPAKSPSAAGVSAAALSAKRGAAAREDQDAALRDELLRVAAGAFRKHGLTGGTMDGVAAAAGVTKAALYRQFASKDLLIQAIFGEIISRLREGDERPWYGYGGGVRNALAAARSFEDGYVLLVREGRQQARYHGFYDALRVRAARRLTALLWLPNRPPPRAERPPLLALTLEPMVSFTNEALAHWVQHGDPARDDLYLRWCGQMIRTWCHNAAQFLNLDSPESDWPFDTENSTPLA